MSIPTYDDNGSAESTIFLGTSGDPPVLISNTAVVHIKGGNEIDKQRSRKANKARIKFNGQELTKIIVNFVLLPEDEDQFWSDTMTILKMPGNRGRALPLDVTNASVNRAGVTVVVVAHYDIGPADPLHGRSVTIDLDEWSSEVFDPKDEPSKGKNIHQAPTGPKDHTFDTALEDVPLPE